MVQQARLRDGGRRIVNVSEVSGLEHGEVVLHDLFTFEQRDVDADGRVIGEHAACARIPSRAQDIVAAGEKLDARSFLTGHVEGGDVKDHHRRMTDWVPDAPPAVPPSEWRAPP